MNACVPLWNMENDYRSSHDLLPAENQSKSMREENELLELVWQNGHVLMQSQTRETTCEHKENSKHGTVMLKNGSLLGNPNNLDQEDETASWMQYHYDDSLAKDFFSDFHGMPTSESIGTDELGKDNIPEERYVKFGFNEETNTFTTPPSKQTSGIHNEETTMPPHNSKIIGGTIPQTGNAEKSEFVSFSHFTRMVKTDAGTCRHSDQKDTRNVSQKGVGKSSSMLSSNWQHNQIHEQPDIGHKLGSAITEALPMQERDVQRKFHERDRSETNDTVTVTSSGGSGSSIGRQGQQITSSQNHKRKGRDVEQSGCHSEEAENQSMEVGRRPQKSKSTHRSRAAEVHNLSERRRRDRINEKMKALQELIPHCNKTDKASMLDEAIEYLKSLQLQVQIMWMGSGMAPMMFLNPHQYMSFMGWGMGQGSIPSIPGSSQTSSIPMPNQSVPPVGITYQEANIPSQALNPVNFSNQMQSSNIPDAHAHYLGFRNMQSPSQAMDLFSSIHSLSIQPNQTTTADSNNPSSRLNPSDNNQNGKSDFLGVA